jgi:hypothetical protein
MSRESITPETMKLNEVEPDGFTSEPRILSREVANMRGEMTNLRAAMLQLVELQSEANKKLEAVLKDQPCEVI